MASVGFWILFLVALLPVAVPSGSGFVGDDVMIPLNHGEYKTAFYNRKLKERSFGVSIDLKDYPHYDPSPSSKAAVRSGPIEHGAPLMPYVPRATPPSHPNP